MNTVIQAIFPCLGRSKDRDNSRYDNSRYDNTVNEKNQFDFKEQGKAKRCVEDATAEFIDTVFTAEKNGKDLSKKLKGIVEEYGWVENIGIAILNGLETAIKEGKKMAPVIKEAFDKATTEAKKFVKDHPVLICTIIALGVLVIIAPWVLELIGFGELGPIEGSWAALWQSRYAGYVPKNSVFSFFQRLGMTWGKSVLVSQDLLGLAD